MERKGLTINQQHKAEQLVDQPEIICLREFQKEENAYADRTQLEKNRQHFAGEQSASIQMPKPKFITRKITLERAKKRDI